MTLPRTAGRRQRTGLRLHFRDLAEDDVALVHGLDVTAPLRTALDCASTSPMPLAVAALESAIRSGVPAEALGEAVAATPRLRRLAGLVDPRSESVLETELRLLLTLAGLQPEVQWVVRVRGREYRLDLAYPAVRLAIEVDGRAYHSDPADFRRDRQRQNDLVLAGWTVLRFTADDIRFQPARVLAAVRTALAA